MKRSLFALTMVVLAGCARLRPAAPPPDWRGKSVFTDDDFVYAAGRSEPQDSERTARDDALAGATAALVDYSGVGVEAFDRSVEIYGRDGDGPARGEAASRAARRARVVLRLATAVSWYAAREGRQHTAAVLLRIPKELLELIRREKGVRLAADLLLYRDDDDGKMRPLVEGEALHSGGGFAAYVRPSDDCYVYLYEVDGFRGAFRLFPNPALGPGSDPLPAGRAAWIPNERGLLDLDPATGKERLYLFVSRERIPELEGPIAALTGRSLDEFAAAKGMSVAALRDKRDPVLVRPPQGARSALEVKEKLRTDGGSIVYETWFRHQ
jgi:hypothetical protein